jgi:hypothetical protein
MSAMTTEGHMSKSSPKPSDLSEGLTNQVETTENHGRATLGDARPDVRVSAHRTDGGRRGDGMDAPPSNTASNKCNTGVFKPLRWGVDSLYLSFPGELADSVEKKLHTLKQAAQSQRPHEQIGAQYKVDEHIFEVNDKGSGLFPFVLQDNCFRIALSRPRAKSLPMAYVQISSHFLSAVTPEAAEDHLRKVLDQLGDMGSTTNVSRIDLFVDFLSDVDMESWDRSAWVTRAHSLNQYSVQGNFSGWAVGLGGVVACRLYDKTLELETSGKDHLKELWAKFGWQEGQKVWRLEFEFKREFLSQKGLSTLRDVLRNRSGIWAYATDDWLRLTIPDEKDKTRSRWPIHPLWQCLASVDWEGDGGVLLPRFTSTRVPDDRYLYGRGLSLIFAFMARDGFSDFFAAGDKYLGWLQSYAEKYICQYEGVSFEQYVQEQVAIRAKRFNTALNLPEDEPEGNIEVEKAARDYLKASKGG